MNAGTILISGIFNNSRLLEIPFYQRSYVWKEEQWERFMEDLEYVTKTKKPYFMGSIILKQGRELRTWENYSDCKVVIDGQQRITTFMIFMKVLCLKLNKNELFERDFVLEDGEIALRHGKNDIDAFQEVIQQTKAEQITNYRSKSRVIEAYNYFIEKVDESLYDRAIIKQNVQFVCIDLTKEEDEQQVFDTINSLGVRLSTAELLKNYFFDNNNVDKYNKIWAAVFEKDDETKAYWDFEIETGRYKRSLIDVFFDAYFQIFIQSKKYAVTADDKNNLYSRIDRLAKSYQHFVDTYCGGDKQTILGDLKEYAECFARIFKPTYCDMSIPAAYGIERLNIVIFGLKNTTMIPFVLYIAKNVTDQNELSNMCKMLESFIMRRMVVHATTKNYNNLFTSFILNNVSDAATLCNKLKELKAEKDATTYIPDNNELLIGFHNSKLYNLQTKGILYLIESGIRPANSSTALLGFNSYSLEHMMPKNWRKNWPECENEDIADARDNMLLTLGNLAIITQSLNSSIRDADWTTKKSGKNSKPGLEQCASGLNTLQDALNKAEWNEDEIVNRAAWLYNEAIKIWDI